MSKTLNEALDEPETRDVVANATFGDPLEQEIPFNVGDSVYVVVTAKYVQEVKRHLGKRVKTYGRKQYYVKLHGPAEIQEVVETASGENVFKLIRTDTASDGSTREVLVGKFTSDKIFKCKEDAIVRAAELLDQLPDEATKDMDRKVK